MNTHQKILRLKDCIRKNGIAAFIAWKAKVVKEDYYDDYGRKYTYIHPTYSYLLELAGLGDFPVWDKDDLTQFLNS